MYVYKGESLFQCCNPKYIIQSIWDCLGPFPNNIYNPKSCKLFHDYLDSPDMITLVDDQHQLLFSRRLQGIQKRIETVVPHVKNDDRYESLLHFITLCLDLNPKLRMTALQALHHPFLSSHTSSSYHHSLPSSPPSRLFLPLLRIPKSFEPPIHPAFNNTQKHPFDGNSKKLYGAFFGGNKLSQHMTEDMKQKEIQQMNTIFYLRDQMREQMQTKKS
ncbi:hypothetical protein RFI_17381 [Reticulomyxa filosa]|uniref:Protein kinase domain-containing protein n=1 Tax=Reticulomyxa filosa TaxID=46433 RepID=X6N1S1_RETFI|nr:hypothetical protein RFI_17381 [Reticulomyxa filosa]|eukprot:ETO19843.1 hypothetical protein RFI_17381 [Reticulomyxa filosa]